MAVRRAASSIVPLVLSIHERIMNLHRRLGHMPPCLPRLKMSTISSLIRSLASMLSQSSGTPVCACKATQILVSLCTSIIFYWYVQKDRRAIDMAQSNHTEDDTSSSAARYHPVFQTVKIVEP